MNTQSKYKVVDTGRLREAKIKCASVGLMKICDSSMMLRSHRWAFERGEDQMRKCRAYGNLRFIGDVSFAQMTHWSSLP